MAVLEAGSGSEVTESGRASPAKELLGGSAGVDSVLSESSFCCYYLHYTIYYWQKRVEHF